MFQDTNISLNLKFLCNITPLNLKKNPKTFALSLHCLASTSLNIYQWVSNAPQISCNKIWKNSSVDWTIFKSILTSWSLCQHVGRTPPTAQ
ncbi:hypothetical protein ACHAXS_000785 [Conticribra weissflogii]